MLLKCNNIRAGVPNNICPLEVQWYSILKTVFIVSAQYVPRKQIPVNIIFYFRCMYMCVCICECTKCHFSNPLLKAITRSTVLLKCAQVCLIIYVPTHSATKITYEGYTNSTEHSKGGPVEHLTQVCCEYVCMYEYTHEDMHIYMHVCVFMHC